MRRESGELHAVKGRAESTPHLCYKTQDMLLMPCLDDLDPSWSPYLCECISVCRGFKALKQVVKLLYKLEEYNEMLSSYR